MNYRYLIYCKGIFLSTFLWATVDGVIASMFCYHGHCIRPDVTVIFLGSRGRVLCQYWLMSKTTEGILASELNTDKMY